MTRKRTLVACGLVVVANAVTLGMAASNRTERPDALLQLTERELRLPAGGGDNSGVLLSLDWQVPPRLLAEAGEPARRSDELDREKLAALGFDTSVALDSPEAEEHYRRVCMVARPAYVVLELEGQGWKAAEARVKADPDTEAAAAQLTRLAAVDVGRDRDALRAKYPDRSRYAVVAGVVKAVFSEGDPSTKTPARLWGYVREVRPSNVNVPRHLREKLEAIVGESAAQPARWQVLDREPRYRVTLAWGRNLEPWIVDILPAEPATAPERR